jgi:hypothetical protein
MRRILSLALAAGTAATFALASPVAQAQTDAQSTTCDVSGTAKFTPGLTLSVQAEKVKVHGSLSGCSGGGVTSATVAGKAKGQLSCTSGTANGSLSVTWDTAETSLIRFSVDVSSGSFSGTVASGKFAGEPVTGSLTLTPITGDCFITPVTKASVSGTASI